MVGQSYSRASRIWSNLRFSPTTFLIKWPTRLPQVSTRHRVTQKNRKGCSEQFWSAKPCSIDAARRDTSIAGLKPFRKFLQRSTAHFLSHIAPVWGLYGVQWNIFEIVELWWHQKHSSDTYFLMSLRYVDPRDLSFRLPVSNRSERFCSVPQLTFCPNCSCMGFDGYSGIFEIVEL